MAPPERPGDSVSQSPERPAPNAPKESDIYILPEKQSIDPISIRAHTTNQMMKTTEPSFVLSTSAVDQNSPCSSAPDLVHQDTSIRQQELASYLHTQQAYPSAVVRVPCIESFVSHSNQQDCTESNDVALGPDPTAPCHPVSDLVTTQQLADAQSNTKDNELPRSPKGSIHDYTLKDEQYLHSASEHSFIGFTTSPIKPQPDSRTSPPESSGVDGSPLTPNSSGKRKRGAKTPRRTYAAPTTVRPTHAPNLFQSLSPHGSDVAIPKGLKALLHTTLKDAIFDVDSPSKRRIVEEKVKSSAPPVKKNENAAPPNKKWRGEPVFVSHPEAPDRYSWYEEYNDDYENEEEVETGVLGEGDPKHSFPSGAPEQGNVPTKVVKIFHEGHIELWETELDTLEWEKYVQTTTGKTRKAWEKDLQLRGLKKEIQEKLRNGHVFILQNLPPANFGIKLTTCWHPFCSSPRRSTPAYGYRLSLKPKANLNNLFVPTQAQDVERTKGQGKGSTEGAPTGQGPQETTWYCLTCVKDLWNGVGQLNVESAAALETDLKTTDAGSMYRQQTCSRINTPAPTDRVLRGTRLKGTKAAANSAMPKEHAFSLDGTSDAGDATGYRSTDGPTRSDIIVAAERAGSMNMKQKAEENGSALFAIRTKRTRRESVVSKRIMPSMEEASPSVLFRIEFHPDFEYRTRHAASRRPVMSTLRRSWTPGQVSKSSGKLLEAGQQAQLYSGYDTKASLVEHNDDLQAVSLRLGNSSTNQLLASGIGREHEVGDILEVVDQVKASSAARAKKRKAFHELDDVTIRTNYSSQESPIQQRERFSLATIDSAMATSTPNLRPDVAEEGAKALPKKRSHQCDLEKDQNVFMRKNVRDRPLLPPKGCTCRKPDDGRSMATTRSAPASSGQNIVRNRAVHSLDGANDHSDFQFPKPHTHDEDSSASRPTALSKSSLITLTPFQSVSSFIRPEKREHNSGYKTVSAPQEAALHK
ncbi:MAG: hypothetical protein M1827_001157 [Pycnora praestabilis]|nr:MAG: hypothetical protein M1827_001157 [Pycnora praestabilis]